MDRVGDAARTAIGAVGVLALRRIGTGRRSGEAGPVKPSRHIATAVGKLLAEQGRLVAHSATTRTILPRARPNCQTGGTRSLSLTVYVSRG